VPQVSQELFLSTLKRYLRQKVRDKVKINPMVGRVRTGNEVVTQPVKVVQRSGFRKPRGVFVRFNPRKATLEVYRRDLFRAFQVATDSCNKRFGLN